MILYVGHMMKDIWFLIIFYCRFGPFFVNLCDNSSLPLAKEETNAGHTILQYVIVSIEPFYINFATV